MTDLHAGFNATARTARATSGGWPRATVARREGQRPPERLPIAEVFRSWQGEGWLTGTESTFIRVAGCNLRCWFCDTPYASWHAEGESLSVEEVLARVDGLGCRHVVLTGGEPLLFAGAVPLSQALRGRGHHVTVETAGTVYRPVAGDLMSISPKLANSTPPAAIHPRWAARHERTRHVPEVVRRLTAEYDYQIKFVIDRPEDCEEVEAYLAGLPTVDRARVMLMPQATDAVTLAAKETWIKAHCRAHGFGYCGRKQIEWFGLQRGT